MKLLVVTDLQSGQERSAVFFGDLKFCCFVFILLFSNFCLFTQLFFSLRFHERRYDGCQNGWRSRPAALQLGAAALCTLMMLPFYPKVARLALIGERPIGQRVVLHWTHPLHILNTYYKIRSVISACNIISLIFSFPISKFSTSSNDRSLAISPPSYIQISYLSL